MNRSFTVVFVCGLLHAQVGLAPREVSPELVRQMRREALTGITPNEAEEHRKLRETDAELLRRIQADERKHSDLERYVGSLDISVDTRLLVEAKDDIKELKRAQKAAEEEAKSERESSREMIGSVKTGVFLLLLGAVFKWIVSWFSGRKESRIRVARHSNVLEAISEVKTEAKAAFSEANNVNAKIASLGMQMRDNPPAGDG